MSWLVYFLYCIYLSDLYFFGFCFVLMLFVCFPCLDEAGR